MPLSQSERLSRLNALSREPDPGKKRLLALAIVSDRLRDEGMEPILVGGAALEFYTAGGYTTKDIDLAVSSGPVVDACFAELGFDKEGRYWYREDLDLLFEAPAPAELPGEDAPRTVVDVDGLRAVIIGVEDLLLDRLRGGVHWQSEEDSRWASRLAMLYVDRLDWAYLRDKTAAVEAEADAMRALEAQVGR